LQQLSFLSGPQVAGRLRQLAGSATHLSPWRKKPAPQVSVSGPASSAVSVGASAAASRAGDRRQIVAGGERQRSQCETAGAH
jgi:hypothetical protein